MAKTYEVEIGQLIPDDKNFNRGTDEGKKLIRKSLHDFGAGRSVLIDKDNRIIAGNKTHENADAADIRKVIVVETDGTELVAVKRTDIGIDTKEGRELALADNATAHVNLEWDVDELTEAADDYGINLDDWGVDFTMDEDEDAILERKRREFEARMAEGELDDDDPEYQEFLKKFEAKKTTDDCYTPDVVYDAVADWVADEYKVSRANFVRPFYPNGDYQNEKYKKTDIVVDNPPFSIMAEILKFYHSHGIRFFLFAPHLTLFSSSSSLCTCLPVGVPITYENGANVNTSFVTNMEEPTTRFRSEPRLYAAVKKANDKNLRAIRRELPKYAYDHHIITTPFISALSRLGIDFRVPVAESQVIERLDSQKESGKAIFGKGYIVSDRVFEEREKAEREKAEREKAEREKAEREKAERWELSEKERKIIEFLNQNTKE